MAVLEAELVADGVLAAFAVADAAVVFATVVTFPAAYAVLEPAPIMIAASASATSTAADTMRANGGEVSLAAACRSNCITDLANGLPMYCRALLWFAREGCQLTGTLAAFVRSLLR